VFWIFEYLTPIKTERLKNAKRSLLSNKILSFYRRQRNKLMDHKELSTKISSLTINLNNSHVGTIRRFKNQFYRS
jgi:pantothenate kinase-related protein Tda10